MFRHPLSSITKHCRKPLEQILNSHFRFATQRTAMPPRKRQKPGTAKAPEPINSNPNGLPHKRGSVSKVAKTEASSHVKEEEKETSMPANTKTEDLVTPTKATKKKAHKYKLDYKQSPFPDHPLPTPEAAEEVHRLLSAKHGVCAAPSKVPPPSSTAAGCGEVPSLLDALLRTVLSANTTSKNSREALLGLIRTFGDVGGSPDWDAVAKASAEEIAKAIFKGGLSGVKGRYIRDILGIIRAQNVERRDALLKEKETGEPADITATSHLTPLQKDAEIQRIADNPLSMDWYFEITPDSAVIDELTKLPGIGVKTASCCLLFNMQRPSFAVDTHVHRHCKWLGWVPPTATADQTFNHCDLRIPGHLKYGLHVLFVKHGKECYRCRANTNPGSKDWAAAESCPIEGLVDRNLGRKGRKKRKVEESEEDSGEEKKTPVRKRKVKEETTPRGKGVKETSTPTSSRPVRASAVKARAKSSKVKDESQSSESESEAASEYDS